MKKFVVYIPFLGLLIISIVSLSFSESKRKAQTCNAIEFTIDKGKNTNKFILENDILASIKKSKTDIIGKKIKEIKIHEIEEAIENNPSVLSCECYFTVKGTCIIDIIQRNPVLRIIGLYDDYYIDDNGRLMPLSKSYSARTIIASGNITDGFRKQYNVLLETPKDSSSLKDLFLITNAINKDSFLNSLIEQIYVVGKDNYILIGKIGPSKIEFGSSNNYDKKLMNLKAFYKSEKVRENWHLYERISVKYENQIVCTKY